MIRSTLCFAVLCLASASLLDAQGQEPALHQPQTIAIRAARLINGKTDDFMGFHALHCNQTARFVVNLSSDGSNAKSDSSLAR